MAALSLADARKHLNIVGYDNDPEILSMVDSVEATIAKRCGSLTVQAFTSVVTANRHGLVLPNVPVVALTSVALYGTSLSIGNMTLDPDSGVISGLYGGWAFAPGRPYTVAYTAGRASVPPDLLLAIKEMLKHTWASQRGGSARPGSGEGQQPASYLMPTRVQELIEPYIQRLGFA